MVTPPALGVTNSHGVTGGDAFGTAHREHASNVGIASNMKAAGKKSKHREDYDFVTARAVARMSVLTELCLPLDEPLFPWKTALVYPSVWFKIAGAASKVFPVPIAD